MMEIDEQIKGASRPALLTAVEKVLEVLSPHYESQVQREAKFGRKGSACVCEVCRAMEAIEGAIEGEH